MTPDAESTPEEIMAQPMTGPSAPADMDYDRLPPGQLTPRVDRNELVAANTRFAVALYKRLAREPGGNLTVSPVSISLALSMVYCGARSKTEAEMKDVLNLPLRGTELAAAAGRLQEELSAFDGNCGLELRVANSAWGQAGFGFLLEFLETLRTLFKSDLGELDFKNQPAEACARINSWIAEHTADRITNVLSPDAINELTRLILVNAVYFRCNWQDEFSESATAPAAFWSTPEHSVEAPLMRRTGQYLYAESPLWQAVVLPYNMSYFSMTVLLPRKKDWLGELELSLDTGFLEALQGAMALRQVELHLPKFRIEGEFYLAPILRAMGMRDAFSETAADFSGISGNERLFLSEVIHRTFIDVNEEGTEATAATALCLLCEKTAEEELPLVVFRADHPFMFLIRDERTKSILFMGRLADPSAPGLKAED